MLLIKIKKTKKRFRAYPTHQAVQTTGSTAMIPMVRAITGMGVQAGTELSRPGCVGDLLPV